MDADQNHRKEDRLVPLENTSEGDKHQMAEENIKWRPVQQDKTRDWTAKIKTRRLRWYGHAMQILEETPAKIALQKAYRKAKKLRGGQTTWISVPEKDLSTLGLTVEGGPQLAPDRDEWRKVVWQSRAPCACALRA